MKLQFKFSATADKKQQDGVVAGLLKHGASSVRALFPGDKDEELACLFVADVADEAAQRRALDFLKKSPLVEFAEAEVKRKLIR